jgi:hypothetical protein
MGHDAVHFPRHAYRLVDDNLPTDNEQEDTTEMEEPLAGSSRVSQNDCEVDEDEAGEESDSSGSNASDDSDSESDSDADTRF